jgi:hypothetical protein
MKGGIMKKSLLALFVMCAVETMCYAIQIQVRSPNGQEKWKLGSTQTISWSLFGTPAIDVTLVKLVLFKGGTASTNKIGNIVQNIAVGPLHVTPQISGTFDWTAGTYEGGVAPAGSDYYIRVISMNGQPSDFSDGPFSLVFSKPPFKIERKFVEWNPDPGCPMCGNFDIGDLLARLGNPVDITGDLVILRNGRQVGLLGKLGQGGLSPDQKVKLRFGADDFALLGQENQGFEVAIVGAGGNILKRQAISLKLKQ